MAFSIPSQAPFRADIVGSFLRPNQLKNARNLHRQKLINDEQLKEVEDACIRDLIGKQIKHGLRVITDGEFRRSWWHFDFMWGLNGITKAILDKGYAFKGIETRAETALLKGKIDGHNHPFVEHFKFVKAFEKDGYGLVARQTVPAPAQTLSTLLNHRNSEVRAIWQDFYTNEIDLIEDLAKAYRQVFTDLYEAGCRSIQIDDCTWPTLCDPAIIEKNKINVQERAELFLLANNKALEHKPDDLVICTHICRGNYRSHYFSDGSYDAVKDVLFAQEKVDAFYLEYDDERSGTFEALQAIPHSKKVVLGLVTSKKAELENLNDLVQRVHNAQKYFPLDNLCVSTQCGFASTEEGNALTEEEQWQKIDLVIELAQKIWG